MAPKSTRHILIPSWIMTCGCALAVSTMLGAAAGRSDAADRPVQAGQPERHALLDVPYLSQTPQLCGGAAVAMVLRYWGARDVFPQDFSPLVGAEDGGILTTILASAVRGRGWQAVLAAAGDETAHAGLRSEIDRGRPLIALIEVGPHAFHYVVIVGATDQEVIVHDPARAPFRVLPWAEFDREWAGSGRWTMLVLPPEGFRQLSDVTTVTPDAAVAAVRPERSSCGALIDRSVDQALAGERETAEQGLLAATRLCPHDAASWRELAGLRFSQARWPEAQDLARTAVRLAPDDAQARQLLATSRYLTGDLMGALDDWNREGEPRIDIVDIHGAARTRQPVVARAAGLEPRQVLTSETFGLARRRLGDLPVAFAARMRYEPLADGRARVDIFLDERPVAPTGWLALGNLGARALVLDEVRIDIAGQFGAGELTSAAWRWTPERPRLAFGLALPSPQWLRGVVALDALWERQSYDATPSPTGGTSVRDERRRVGLHVADWATSWLHWQAGAALDRLGAADVPNATLKLRDNLAIESSIDVRLANDRLAISASVGGWASFAGGDRFGAAALLAAWRSTADGTRPSWSALTEYQTATHTAPLAIWPGAGTGQGRSGLLRAHPLLSHGVLSGPVFGRELLRGTVEYARPDSWTPHGRGNGSTVCPHRRSTWTPELACACARRGRTAPSEWTWRTAFAAAAW